MDNEHEDTAVNVPITLFKEDEDELIVRYAEKDVGESPLLGASLVLRRSALPDPPPSLVRATLRWEQAVAGPADVRMGTSQTGERVTRVPLSQWTADVKAGDTLTVIKSRGASVKSPPEWLEQYVGRTGRVLWTTADGAMLDIDGKASWFSYQELKPGA